MIYQKEFSIDWDNEEFHHRVSIWLNRFLIPLQSIEKYIQSTKRNSQSIETRKNWIFLEFYSNHFLQFLLFSIKNTFLILWMKIYKSNIKVFEIIIKNPNNARNPRKHNPNLIRNKFHNPSINMIACISIILMQYRER